MELIIFSAILVVSVVAHYFFWRDSKKQFDACIKQAEALTERLQKLEANRKTIDGMLGEVEDEVQKMGDELDTLRSALFSGRKRTGYEN